MNPALRIHRRPLLLSLQTRSVHRCPIFFASVHAKMSKPPNPRYFFPRRLTMEFTAADFERLLMFEHTRKACEAQYVNDPLECRDSDEAKGHFDKAAEYLQRAENEDPGNEVYRKSLEVAARGPELHREIHKHGMGQQMLGGGGGGASGSVNASSGSNKNKNKKKNNDFTYDVCGWIILAFGIVAWVGMAKSLGPPPPTR